MPGAGRRGWRREQTVQQTALKGVSSQAGKNASRGYSTRTGKHLLGPIMGRAVCQGAEDTDVRQRSLKDPVADEMRFAGTSKPNGSGARQVTET